MTALVQSSFCSQGVVSLECLAGSYTSPKMPSEPAVWPSVFKSLCLCLWFSGSMSLSLSLRLSVFVSDRVTDVQGISARTKA